MDSIFSDRIADVPRSFIREILKVTAQPEIISFAGGLLAPERFPVDVVRAAASEVLGGRGSEALQYGPSGDFLPLREWIAAERGRNSREKR